MLNSRLPCPQVGHRSFEKSLSEITIGDTDTPAQISKFIRTYTCVEDELGMKFQMGELQKVDMIAALTMFAYPQFIQTVFKENVGLFRHSQCRIYQFQTLPKSKIPFIFGLIITDGAHNLIDFCTQSPQSHKRRTVLLRLIRAICTPESIARKISH